jgi:hypothetical protein
MERYILFTGLLRDLKKFLKSIETFKMVKQKYNIKEIIFVTWENEVENNLSHLGIKTIFLFFHD